MRIPLLALLLSFLIKSLVGAVEKPFNFNETPGKLPKEVVPTEYAVRIVPNLDNFTFTGSETVKLNVRSPVHQLVLNGLELKIETAAVDGKELPPAAIKTDNKKELLTLALPSELEVGDHALTLGFTGKINQQGQGLFYMRYQEQGSGARKVMLGTQFEATDARRFFPCWDEPAFRARFQLTAVVPENWLAVSNMPIESEMLLNGRDGPAGRPFCGLTDGPGLRNRFAAIVSPDRGVKPLLRVGPQNYLADTDAGFAAPFFATHALYSARGMNFNDAELMQ